MHEKKNLQIGGTMCISVALCCFITSINVFGLNSGNVTILLPRASFATRVTVNPKMWKKGRTPGETSWYWSVVGKDNCESPNFTPNCSQLTPILLWLSITPFGNPVVPEEYGNNTISSGWRLCGRNELKSTSKKKIILKKKFEIHFCCFYLLFMSINSLKSIAPLGIASSTSVLIQMILMSFLQFLTASLIVAKDFGVPMIAFALLDSNCFWISTFGKRIK